MKIREIEKILIGGPNMTNDVLCSKCQGYCCQHQAGEIIPEDIIIHPSSITIDKIRYKILALLDTGFFCVDWWEGDPRNNIALERELSCGYYIRPKVLINGIPTPEMFHAGWGGRCVFLTSTGCMLSKNKRPFGCRKLIPNPHFPHQCSSNIKFGENSKHRAALRWIKFHSVFEEIRRKNNERQ